MNPITAVIIARYANTINVPAVMTTSIFWYRTITDNNIAHSIINFKKISAARHAESVFPNDLIVISPYL